MNSTSDLTLPEACVFLKLKYNLTFSDYKVLAEWLDSYQYLPQEGSCISPHLQKVVLELELTRCKCGREIPIGRAYRNLCLLDTALDIESQNRVAVYLYRKIIHPQ